jgi:hypothetical protein
MKPATHVVSNSGVSVQISVFAEPKPRLGQSDAATEKGKLDDVPPPGAGFSTVT